MGFLASWNLAKGCRASPPAGRGPCGSALAAAHGGGRPAGAHDRQPAARARATGRAPHLGDPPGLLRCAVLRLLCGCGGRGWAYVQLVQVWVRGGHMLLGGCGFMRSCLVGVCGCCVVLAAVARAWLTWVAMGRLRGQSSNTSIEPWASCPATIPGPQGQCRLSHGTLRLRCAARLQGIDSRSMGAGFVATAGRILGHLGDVMTLGFTPAATAGGSGWIRAGLGLVLLMGMGPWAACVDAWGGGGVGEGARGLA